MPRQVLPLRLATIELPPIDFGSAAAASLNFPSISVQASSQLISSQPGSSSKPFFGLVRFMGFVIRLGS